jgi:glyoxylate reductase
LKVVANIEVGYNNIDVAACTARGVMVTNTPGVLDDSTADLAWTLMLGAARRITEVERRVRNGEWTGWRLKQWLGTDVHHATLGIVGMGRIGQAVARRAAGFGMRILYHNRSRRPDAERTTGAQYAPFDELLRESDYVVLLTPLTEETRNLMGEREFSLMKPTAVFVNVSRGGTVDEAALYRALVDKQIWAAGLDVFQQEPVPLDNPLLSLPNVVALPHIGSATYQTRLEMARLAAANIAAVLSGEEPVTPV